MPLGLARVAAAEEAARPPAGPQPAAHTNLTALPPGTVLAGDYRIERVLGAGGFGITYLAEEVPLDRLVAIKEYFPVDFAARDQHLAAQPRSMDCQGDYHWGLDRFLDEARTLARFDHPNIVRVYRFFREGNAGFMVLSYEEGQSFKGWLKSLGRAPRQAELDRLLSPLLDALEMVHAADYLHRDIAPDNIIIRRDGSPVLIDFGAARCDIAQHSRTVSALVKPGYSPYEQYASTSSRQGPWTDIYSLAATLYQAVTGKRPTDAPSRMVEDDLVPARDAALSSYRPEFLAAIDAALALDVTHRPRDVPAWRRSLFTEPEPAPRRGAEAAVPPAVAPLPPPPDVPLAEPAIAPPTPTPPPAAPAEASPAKAAPQLESARSGLVARLARLVGGRRPAAPPLSEPPAPHAASAIPIQPAATGKGARPPVKSPPPAEPAEGKVEPPARRARPRPFRLGQSRSWRPFVAKAAVGIAVAGLAVYLQDLLRSPEPTAPAAGGPITTARLPGSQIGEIKGHRGGVSGVAYTPDGRRIVTLGEDGTAKIWRADNSALVATLALDGARATSLFIRDGRAAIGHRNGLVEVWDLERGERLARMKRNEAEVWSVVLAEGGTRVIAASHDWKVAVHDVAKPAEPPRLYEGHTSAAKVLAIGPDGDLVVSGGADHTVRLWSLALHSSIGNYRAHNDYVSALAVSPDGRRVASGDLAGEVRIWSAGARRTMRVIKAHRGPVTAAAYAPDGRLLATAGQDGVVRLWDLDGARTSRSLNGHAGEVRALSFSPDGKRLASAGADGVVRVWTTARPAAARR